MSVCPMCGTQTDKEILVCPECEEHRQFAQDKQAENARLRELLRKTLLICEEKAAQIVEEYSLEEPYDENEQPVIAAARAALEEKP